jgi:hypothetical protein
MDQLYVLFLIFNTMGGIILCAEFLKEKTPGFSKFVDLINTKEVKFIVAIATLIIGFFKFFLPMGGGWIIIGDFLPATVSITLSFALWLDFYKETSNLASDFLKHADELLLKNRNLLGGLCILTSIIHFFFARVPLFL